MSRLRPLIPGLVLLAGVAFWLTPPSAMAKDSGGLIVLGPDGQPIGMCPLEHTSVECEIVGFLGRTRVKQVFKNEGPQKIEAVYVFPLPQDAAVDQMVMLVGDRRVVGQIKEREEARRVYEAAKAAGHVASLLDQERPNIFTQSVANIEPGATVEIEIAFCETLKYDDGLFEWVFPMVVGPRYNPGGGSAPAPMTNGQPTPQVPDADRITPPITPEGTRAGHDISVTVRLTPGMPLADLKSELHDVNVSETTTADGPQYTITLKDQAAIPNKDFVLRYRLTAERVGDAFFVSHDERGDFFTLILQPPQRVEPRQIVPRELIFVLDTSGSMSGAPIEKAKQAMNRLIDTMNPQDSFNLITFAGDTRVLWNKPRANSAANRAEAQRFLTSSNGGGGTEMMKAIEAALRPTSVYRGLDDVKTPIRVVCFMTDGYVGNDMEIIDAVKRYAGSTRVFSFGVGNSVNRFLLDGMASAGRGEVEYVTLQSESDESVARFHQRILAPVLTDIQIDWGTLPVADVTPSFVPDLFSSKPIVVRGRLIGASRGDLTLRGRTGAGRYEERIHVAEDAAADRDAIPAFWARSRIQELMSKDYAALQRGEFPEPLKREIINLGLSFNLVTQFTSFVAVEELTITRGGQPVKVQVPVEMPDGVSYEGIFGKDQLAQQLKAVGYAGSGIAVAGRPVATAAPTGVADGARKKAPSTQVPVKSEAKLGDADARESNDEMPIDKLAPALRELAKKVDREGKNGTLIVDGIQVRDYLVEVSVRLRDGSDQTLTAIKQLGFEISGNAIAAHLVLGKIDVRKLEELSKLDVVLCVEPLK